MNTTNHLATAAAFAARLHGRPYPLKITRQESDEARAAGLVIVYGASDDLMEFDGAISEEVGAYEGTTATVSAAGVAIDWESLDKDDESEVASYFEKKRNSRTIQAIWSPKDQPETSWVYQTDIPHVTFDVVEDGEVFCRGIVFNLADLAQASKAPAPDATATLAALPAIGAELSGGIFAGLTTTKTGEHVAVVLLPNKPGRRLTWAAAKTWATEAGGQLPTRPIAALLYANLKGFFEAIWYWTGDELQADPGDEDDASSAWYCYFGDGYQSLDHESAEGAAVAVRLIPVRSLYEHDQRLTWAASSSVVIAGRGHVQAAFARALALAQDREAAIYATAQSLGLPLEAVREVVAQEQEGAAV